MNGWVQRWPLHPRRRPGEALSSWLDRVSGEHSLTLRDLLEHNLGSASIVDEGWTAADLDWDPHDRVLAARARAEVSERAGAELGDLRAMTFAGWVPWLMDGLDEGDQEHFDTYVRQDSVLLASGEVGRNVVPRWRPWLTPQAVRHQCPVCGVIATKTGIPSCCAIPWRPPPTTAGPAADTTELGAHQLSPNPVRLTATSAQPTPPAAQIPDDARLPPALQRSAVHSNGGKRSLASWEAIFTWAPHHRSDVLVNTPPGASTTFPSLMSPDTEPVVGYAQAGEGAD
ncbi:TniQ family protein [Actinomadura sp. 9N215]|uniref:TniQ family protein n=1 Tax=Actinomadura sp. 9N215 TaxID=3375150 RepID=UPI0037B4229A